VSERARNFSKIPVRFLWKKTVRAADLSACRRDFQKSRADFFEEIKAR